MFARVDHIGVAVEDLDAALPLYRDVYAMELVHREVVEAQGVEAVLLDVGENHVELLAPLGPDTPVGRFLAARGPGMHHVAYQVTDIERTLGALREQGLRLIDETPADRHPRVARGVRPPEVHRRRPDRDRPARGGPLTWHSASVSASRPARPSPSG